MKRKDSQILFRFGTVVKSIGSFGVGACSVALLVTFVRSGNVATALAVGIALSAVLAYWGDHIEKAATFLWIGGDDGDD